MHREAAAKRPGVLTKIGMDTFADPAREGCAMNERAAARADRPARRLRRRGLALLQGRHSRRRDHPGDDRGRARQSLLRARGRLSRAARPGARGPQQWRHRHRPGEAPRQERHLEAARRPRPRHPRRRDRRRARPDADDAHAVRAGHLGRDLPPAVELRGAGVRRPEGDRPPRRAGDALRRRRQHRLRHLGQRAAHPHRGGPPRRRDLGHRAGRRRRRAAARLPVRLRLERRGDRARRPTSSPISRAAASTPRCCPSCRSTGTAPSTSRSSACARM